MMPWEREVYVSMLIGHLKKKADKKKQQQEQENWQKMADERVNNQMIYDQLEGVMDRLEKSDPNDPTGMFGKSVKDLSTSKDFKTLQKIVDETHERLAEDTEILKGDAATNKLANKV